MEFVRRLLLLVLFWWIAGSAVVGVATDEDFAVAGYLPDYRFYINLANAAPFLTDLMLFSVQPNADGSLSSCCLDDSHYQKARQAARLGKSKLRLWLTIGGGGRSHDFVKAMETHPKDLVISLLKKASTEHVQGIDLDCESFTSQQDFRTYVMWLLQYAIPNLQKANLQVSVALHAGMFLPPQIYEQVDRIHLMAYDMLDSGGSHASLSKVKDAVSKLIQHGCDPQKILLGIPAYARHVENPGAVKTFAELVDDTDNDEDSVSKLDEWKGYTGDSPTTVAEKVAYAKEMRLGGVFFWELGQDKQVQNIAPGGYLLEAAAKAAVEAVDRRDEL